MKRDTRTTRRHDRVALIIIGLLAVAAATVVLLVSFDVINVGELAAANRPILTATVDRDLRDDRWWWQLGAVAAGALLLFVGIRWVRRQLPTGRELHDHTLGDLDDDTPGDTTLAGRALADGFAADLARHPDVLDARADIHLDDHLIRVRLTTPDATDLNDLVAEVVRPAIARLVTVADAAATPTAHIDVRLRPTPRSVQ